MRVVGRWSSAFGRDKFLLIRMQNYCAQVPLNTVILSERAAHFGARVEGPLLQQLKLNEMGLGVHRRD